MLLSATMANKLEETPPRELNQTHRGSYSMKSIAIAMVNNTVDEATERETYARGYREDRQMNKSKDLVRTAINSTILYLGFLLNGCFIAFLPQWRKRITM